MGLKRHEPEVLCRVNSNTDVRVAYVGGNYNDNANYGMLYLNANNDTSNANANRGSRHLV